MAARGRTGAQGESGQKLHPGGHAAMIFSDPRELERAHAFLAEGVKRREATCCLAYGRFNERVAAQLRDLHGLDCRRAAEDGTLTLLGGHESAKLMRAELVKRFAEAEHAGRAMRLLTCFGWGEAGWPDETDLVQLEAQMNALAESSSAMVLCLYDARQVGGALLLHGALECHRELLVRGELHKNPMFVSPSAVQREMNAKRRDDDRLRSWLA